MKRHTDRSKILRNVFLLAGLLAVLPACNATAQHHVAKPEVIVAGDTTRRSVFRPILEKLPTRTFYLSGYAGATYPPLGQRLQDDPNFVRSARRPIFFGRFGKR